jgi:hypothetical protein
MGREKVEQKEREEISRKQNDSEGETCSRGSEDDTVERTVNIPTSYL